MSTSTPRSYLAYRRQKTAEAREWQHREKVQDAVNAGAIAKELDRPDVLEEVTEALVRLLLGADGQHLSYHAERLDINTLALARVINSQATSANYESAYESLVTVAQHHGLVDSEVTDTVVASEYEHQIGERYYSPDSPGSNDVDLIDPDGDLKATLCTGSQGSGKSTAIETLVEDRIAHGHKIVDIIDYHKSENAMYDVPSQDDKLRGIREDMGLPAGFDDSVAAGFAQVFDDADSPDAYLGPGLEVLAPLTHDLENTYVPYNEQTDEHVVKPFTIPASELTYRQLVMLLPHTTKTMQNYLQSAHQYLSKTDKDWTLSDIAGIVRQKTNAGESIADRIERALETAQNKSFIRDKESDHRLDWQRIMQDVGTVTAFTAHMLEEWSDKLLIISYLLDSIYEERSRLIRQRSLHEYPTLSVVMRELHSVAPRQKAEQDTESTIEGYMIDTLSDLFALMRHVNMELLADTQKFHQQLSPHVSGLFHRVFAFNGQKPDIKQVFRTRVDTTDPVETVAQFDTGEAALVSGDGYTMPIKFAPPRCHHLDAKNDGDAFRARCDYLEEETLVESPWDASIPPRLQFADGASNPIAKFAHECLTDAEGSEFLLKDTVAEAYTAWAKQNDERDVSASKVKRWVSAELEFDSGQTTRGPGEGRQSCWWGIAFTLDPRDSGTTSSDTPPVQTA